ncbi:MAG: hypothetical protein JEY79_17995 [Pseudodesulfovibrio sp.]|nr:hypothetical protein [Pseudodesulfovibrio sp.]
MVHKTECCESCGAPYQSKSGGRTGDYLWLCKKCFAAFTREAMEEEDIPNDPTLEIEIAKAAIANARGEK